MRFHGAVIFLAGVALVSAGRAQTVADQIAMERALNGTRRDAAAATVVMEEQRRQIQELEWALARQIDRLREDVPTAAQIVDEIERRAAQQKVRAEIDRLEAERKEQRRREDETREKAELLRWAFGPGRNSPKQLVRVEGGGTIKRGERLVTVPGRRIEQEPFRGKIPLNVRAIENGYVPAPGFMWVYPTRRAWLNVVEVDPAGMTDEQWSQAVAQSLARCFARYPFLKVNEDPRRKWVDAVLAEQSGSVDYAVLFSSSRWPELIVKELADDGAWPELGSGETGPRMRSQR